MAEDLPKGDAPAPAISQLELSLLLKKIRSSGAEREAYMREAYSRVFAGEIGRLVLLDHLQASGVGRQFGAQMSDAQLRYSVGLHDGAITLANAAGYDEAALASHLLAQDLPEEIYRDERNPSDAPGVVFDGPALGDLPTGDGD